MLSRLLSLVLRWFRPPPKPTPPPEPKAAPAPPVGALGVSEAGLNFIKREEGLRLVAYQDGGGVWTIGYGATGPDIKQGLVWTVDQAQADLTRRCTVLAYRITQASGRSLTQGQLDALVSFTYNLGFHALMSSKLWTYLQYGDVEGAAAQFPRWVHDNGHVVRGLQLRRAREKELFLHGNYTASLV